MKVLQVIPGVGVGGGAERSLFEVAPGLHRAGFDLAVAYFHDRPSSAVDELIRGGVAVHHCASPSAVGRVRAVHGLIERWQPTIVHTSIYEADIVGRWAAVGTGPRVLTSLVNMSYEPARYDDPAVTRWRLDLVRRGEGFGLRHLTDHVHAVSASVKAAAVEALGLDPAHITVAYRGRDQDRLGTRSPARRARVRAALDLPDVAPLIVAVGRQEHQKAQIHLLEALPAVLGRHPQATLLVAGRDGTATPTLQHELRRTGIGDRVRFLGHRDDVGDLLAAADIAALPSLWEGVPGTVVEAMAVGTPIVASAIGPVRELVDGTSARLVTPGDPVALATALIEVLDDPGAAAQRAEVARRRFQCGFTIAHASEAMGALYRQVAEQPVRRWGARTRGGRLR